MAEWEVKPIEAITAAGKKHPVALAALAGAAVAFIFFRGKSGTTEAQESSLQLPPVESDQATSGLPGSAGAALPDYAGMTEDLMALMMASVQAQQENQAKFLEQQAKQNETNLQALAKTLSSKISSTQEVIRYSEEHAPTANAVQHAVAEVRRAEDAASATTPSQSLNRTGEKLYTYRNGGFTATVTASQRDQMDRNAGGAAPGSFTEVQ